MHRLCGLVLLALFAWQPFVHAQAQSADLAIAITGPATAAAGTDITYQITVTNLGPNDAQNAAPSAPVPSNTSFVSFVQNSGPATGGTLPANGTQTFTAVLHVDPTASVGTVIVGEVAANSTTADPNPGNSTASLSTTIIAAPSVATTAIPTLAPLMLALLALGLAGFGARFRGGR